MRTVRSTPSYAEKRNRLGGDRFEGGFGELRSAKHIVSKTVVAIRETDIGFKCNSVFLKRQEGDQIINIFKIGKTVRMKDLLRNLSFRKQFCKSRVCLIDIRPNCQGIFLAVLLVDLGKRLIARSECRLFSDTLVSLYGPCQFPGRVGIRRRQNDHIIIVCGAATIRKFNTLHAFYGFDWFAHENERAHNQPSKGIALSGKQHNYSRRRIILRNACYSNPHTAYLLEFGQHIRIQKTSHDVLWCRLTLRPSADSSKGILNGSALEHIEYGFNLLARAADFDISQSIGRHQSRRVGIAQLLHQGFYLADNIGLVAIVGDQRFKNQLGLLLLLLLHITHSLPIQGLCHMRPLRRTIFDDLRIDLDSRIEIAIDLLGVEAFLQQHTC